MIYFDTLLRGGIRQGRNGLVGRSKVGKWYVAAIFFILEQKYTPPQYYAIVEPNKILF